MSSSDPAPRISPRKTEPGAGVPSSGKARPSFLLHVCCGPCATHVMDLLHQEGYHLVGLFYNPNLFPMEEFYKRLQAAARACRTRNTALWVLPPGQGAWKGLVKGLEAEPEGGRRCTVCIRHRLEVTAWIAAATSVDAFGTTLTIGPRKDSNMINRAGTDLARIFNVPFFRADFKKNDGFLKSVRKSTALGLYRQNYCGCRFSMRSPPGPFPREAGRQAPDNPSPAGGRS